LPAGAVSSGVTAGLTTLVTEGGVFFTASLTAFAAAVVTEPAAEPVPVLAPVFVAVPRTLSSKDLAPTPNAAPVRAVAILLPVEGLEAVGLDIVGFGAEVGVVIDFGAVVEVTAGFDVTAAGVVVEVIEGLVVLVVKEGLVDNAVLAAKDGAVTLVAAGLVAWVVEVSDGLD